MFLHELLRCREGVLFTEYGLQPVEIQECEFSKNEIPRFNMVPIIGPNARYLIDNFRNKMRSTYGFVPKKPFGLESWIYPTIKKVIFNDPATVVIWSDNTKTIVKCQPGDEYSKELGLAMCISKKFLGNKGNFNEEFKKWIPEESVKESTSDEKLSIYEMRKKIGDFCDYRLCSQCPLRNVTHCYTRANDEEIKHNYDLIKDLLD